MAEDRTQILEMLAQGKVTAAEAEALLDALSPVTRVDASAETTAATPKYLHVLVEGETDGKPNRVNVRVPIELIRAGMRLAALLPTVAHEPVNRALQESGIAIDISKLSTEDLTAWVSQLHEVQMEVDTGTDKVRIYCD